MFIVILSAILLIRVFLIQGKLVFMQSTNTGEELSKIIVHAIDADSKDWMDQKLKKTIQNTSAKDLYLTYSLAATKIKSKQLLDFPIEEGKLKSYLQTQNAQLLQLVRIYLLIRVLEADEAYFSPKVANIIQVADTSELETFLKFLILLPNAEAYKEAGVEALRTNIATIFDAIALRNPYPSLHFNEQQWNQMYLKAAFMERDLHLILDVDERANAPLARIISDYAHERWAASRLIDPLFWRPVTHFLDEDLLLDMKRLLESDIIDENRAGALCCYHSKNEKAQGLLATYPMLKKQLEANKLNWTDINQ